MRDFDRSARFWLRAYPREWRTERGAEVASVVRDLAADGARRVDLRTAWDLVRGGLATRRRMMPPLRVYLPYRMFGVRVPVQHRDWVRRDLMEPGYLRRHLLGQAWIFAMPVYSGLASGFLSDFLVMWAVLAVVLAGTLLCTRPDRNRHRRLKYQLRPGPGEPRTVGQYEWVRSPRVRLAAEPVVRLATELLAVGAVVCSVAVLVAPQRDVTRGAGAVVLAVGASAGLLAARGLDRRCVRRLPELPVQPARTLVGPARHARLGVALWALLLVAGATAELTGAWTLAFSLLVAPAALALLPVSIVAWSWARATPGLAFVDVRHVGYSNAPVAVEKFDVELVPTIALGAR
jgi:hypothetical protein